MKPIELTKADFIQKVGNFEADPKDWKYIETSFNPVKVARVTNIETGYSTEPQLYDMKESTEQTNKASLHPEIVFKLQQILKKIQKQGSH